METIALTYRELAERLGIKPESARKTAQRRRWHRTTANDDLRADRDRWAAYASRPWWRRLAG